MKIIIVMSMVAFGLTANAGWIGNLIFYNIGKDKGESECRAQNAELVELQARVELLESIIANHPEAQKELDIAEQESESKDTKPIDALTIIVVVTMVAAIVIGGFMSDWLMVKRRQERKRRTSELSQWNVRQEMAKRRVRLH